MLSYFDPPLFYWFNSWAGVSSFFDWMIIFRAEYLFSIFLLALLCFPLLTVFTRFRALRKRNSELLVFATTSGLLARFFFAEIIRFFYNRPRPFDLPAEALAKAGIDHVTQLIPHVSGGSFPSGHASFAFAVTAAVAWYYPKTSVLFFLLALSIGFGRVSAGIHWPSDILGGAIVGIGSAWIVHAIRKRFYKK